MEALTAAKIRAVGSLILVGLFSLSLVGQAEASSVTVERVLELVNQSRLEAGVEPVVLNEKLMQAAKGKLQDMIQKDYFAHESPEGLTPWYWIEGSGYAYAFAGENLAIDFTSAEVQHQAWLESETHRKNLLSPRYREIGISIGEGVFENKRSIVTVQMFGSQSLSGSSAAGLTRVSWREIFGADESGKSSSLMGSIVPTYAPDNSGLISGKFDLQQGIHNFVAEASQFLDENRGRMANVAWLTSLVLLLAIVALNPVILWMAYVRR